MNKPFISYLVTCKNEGYSLQFLFDTLFKYKDDAETIILDDYSDDVDTLSVLQNVEKNSNGFFKVYKRHLDKNYGEHKNYGKSLCKVKWVFQIDADEIPSEILMENLKDILKENEDVELFWVPRINDFVGVTQQHANNWGWRLTEYKDRKIVNWPDYQSRIFQNKEYIKWERKLHERIEHIKTYSRFPEDIDFALIHNKTIEKQENTNLRYNKEFSEDDNKGFKV